MRKLTLTLALVACFIAAIADATPSAPDDGGTVCLDCIAPLPADNPIYKADAEALQKRLNACDPHKKDCQAARKAAAAFDRALQSGLYSCAGLNFDAQQPGHPEAKRLYHRYCTKPSAKPADSRASRIRDSPSAGNAN